MQRVATVIGQGCSICLLLLAAVIPNVDCCVLHFLVEHHHEEKEGPAEEQRARESVVHVSRRDRADNRGSDASRSHVHLDRLPGCRSRCRGQVCMADALRGDDRFRNGCGAVLLR